MRRPTKPSLLLFLWLAAAPGALASEPVLPCGGEASERLVGSFLFRNFGEARQSALLSVEDNIAGFIEAYVEGRKLGLKHTFPGVGLPFDLLHVRLQVLDSEGREVPGRGEAWPGAGLCEPRPVYPGQDIAIGDLPRAERAERVRVEIWGRFFSTR